MSAFPAFSIDTAADIAHAPFTGRVARAVAADEALYGNKSKLAAFITRPRPALTPAVNVIVDGLYTLPCGAHPMSFDRALCVKVVGLVGFDTATVEHGGLTFDVETNLLRD